VSSERDRPSVALARERFAEEVRDVTASRLVFLDETGTHISMTREHGWAPRGERVFGRVPRNRGTVTTVIGALTYDGLEALMAVEGGTSAAVFQRFVDEHLVPILRPDDVVVMDNLGAHHATGIREAIEAHGARVLYMPAYSPDLNAIELCWSKFKTILKSVGARTGATLREAIRRAARHIRPRDAVAWIDHVLAQLK
jgi:transposase